MERCGGIRCLFGSAVTWLGEKSGGKGRGCVRERIGVLFVVQSEWESQQGKGDKYMRRAQQQNKAPRIWNDLSLSIIEYFYRTYPHEISIRPRFHHWSKGYLLHFHPLVF